MADETSVYLGGQNCNRDFQASELAK